MTTRASFTAESFAKHAYGIFVGISIFQDPDYAKRPIPNAIADAEDVAAALIENWGWLPENIISINGRVMLEEVAGGFRQLLRLLERDDEPTACLIYFSTHGHILETHNSSLILLATDSRVANTDPITALNGLTRSKFESYINVLPGTRKVIILDACYSGSVSAAAITTNDIYQPSDAVVLASARLRSRFDPKARNSEFTEALLRCLRRRGPELSAAALFEGVASDLRKVEGAPKPILRAEGASILLGISESISAPRLRPEEIVQYFGATTRTVLSRVASIALEKYIPRPQLERSFSDFLGQTQRSAFTLVAAAGNGKSTSMRELALRCVAEDYPVLWFPEPRSERELDFTRFLVASLPPGTEADLRVIPSPGKPLIIFFDGINEWHHSEKVSAFFSASLKLAAEHGWRIVVSCRELAWRDFGEPFTSQNTFARVEEDAESKPGKISAYLSVFDEQELTTALQAYPGMQAFATGQLAHHPLFFAVLVRTIDSLESMSEGTTLSIILREYIKTKSERIANRLNLKLRQVLDAIALLSDRMLHKRVESVPADEYFQLTGNAIGTALLDEGLFTFSAFGITTEAQLILEYLLSRRLPQDPLANFEDFEHQAKAFRRIEGAALFRLCEISDELRVADHLRALQKAGYREMLLEAMLRLPSLVPYEAVFLNALARDAPFAMIAPDALRPLIKREFSFCMKAARHMFLHAHYYEWELKRWESTTYESLRLRLDEHLISEGQFLFECIESEAEQALDTLLSDWLVDTRSLEGGRQAATIAGVASVFIRGFISKHGDKILTFLDQHLDSSQWDPNPYLLSVIIDSLATSNPTETTKHALCWLSTEKSMRAALNVMNSLPKSSSDLAEQLGKLLVKQQQNESIANEALSSFGRHATHSVLQFIEMCSKVPNLRIGVLAALGDVYALFPNEALRIATNIAWDPSLPRLAAEVALRFYAIVGKANFLVFKRYAEHALSRFPDEDFQHTVFSTLAKTFSATDSAVHDFAESWLRAARGGFAIEYLAMMVRGARRLNEADISWLERWIEYPNASYYPDLLRDSDISPETSAALLVSIQIKRDLAISNIGTEGDRLHAVARKIATHPTFEKFPKPVQQWWRDIANGDSIRNAFAHREEVVNDLLAQRGQRKRRNVGL